ncbi:hypothetical protein GCM10015535_34370 [Streptomyces gelaticus]|uniref:Uncharacterized protein n=1 Tax=Streptomyces gelaticus TaxID=285446 RepID=A0ABQ2W2F8_9ACTN|nr:hypothetical protein GCM10015535_34370 [Streptomyces gelaticus]
MDRPDVPRDRGFQVRRHDKVRALPADGFPDGVFLVRELHGNGVPVVPQLRLDTLGKAVEGACDKQDVHGDLPVAAVRPDRA